MDQEKYLTDRVDNQQQWYSKKSGTNKSYYVWSKGLIIVLSALIPLGAGFIKGDDIYMKFFLAALGASVAIITGVSAVMKFHEKWLMYRKTAEALLSEKYLFITATGRYQEEQDPFQLFVTRVEALLSEEHADWHKTLSKSTDKQ